MFFSSRGSGLKTIFALGKSALRTPKATQLNSTIRNPYRVTSKMPLITISQSLDEAYTKHKIIPDVVDKFDTHGLMTIEFNEKHSVALGNTLKVEETQERPRIQFTLNSPNQDKEMDISAEDKFCIVMTDPDAPANWDHKWSEYAHWFITDLTLKTTSDKNESPEALSTLIDLSKGKEVLPYVGPAPPPKTKKHRYVILLFKQDPSIKSFEPPKDRPTWGTGVPSSGVRDYFKKHGGNSKLLSVNFFYAQNNEQ